MRILALQLKRIGDLVLTLPALRALKEAGGPAAHFTLVHTDTTAPLLPAMGEVVDQSLTYRTQPGGGGNGNGNAALWRSLWNGQFDVCVDFTGRDRSALMTLLARAPRRVIARSALRGSFWRRFCYNAIVEAPVRSRHTVDFYLEHALAAFPEEHASAQTETAKPPFQKQGRDGSPSRPKLSGTTRAQSTPAPAPTASAPAPAPSAPAPILHLPAPATARANELLAAHGIAPGARYIVIHPGSARPEKYWVPERWAEVIAYCQKALRLPCVLTGGQGDAFEDRHLEAIQAALDRTRPGQPPQTWPAFANLAGQLDLLSLAAVLAGAAIFVGVDSGPMHLAAAFARPQIVLFGPTNPFHWRPRQPACLVLQSGHGDLPVTGFQERSPGGPLDAISTQAVISCIDHFRPAS